MMTWERPRKKRDAILGRVASRGDRRTPINIITAEGARSVNDRRSSMTHASLGPCPQTEGVKDKSFRVFRLICNIWFHHKLAPCPFAHSLSRGICATDSAS